MKQSLVSDRRGERRYDRMYRNCANIFKSVAVDIPMEGHLTTAEEVPEDYLKSQYLVSGFPWLGTSSAFIPDYLQESLRHVISTPQDFLNKAVIPPYGSMHKTGFELISCPGVYSVEPLTGLCNNELCNITLDLPKEQSFMFLSPEIYNATPVPGKMSTYSSVVYVQDEFPPMQKHQSKKYKLNPDAKEFIPIAVLSQMKETGKLDENFGNKLLTMKSSDRHSPEVVSQASLSRVQAADDSSEIGVDSSSEIAAECCKNSCRPNNSEPLYFNISCNKSSSSVEELHSNSGNSDIPYITETVADSEIRGSVSTPSDTVLSSQETQSTLGLPLISGLCITNCRPGEQEVTGCLSHADEVDNATVKDCLMESTLADGSTDILTDVSCRKKYECGISGKNFNKCRSEDNFCEKQSALIDDDNGLQHTDDEEGTDTEESSYSSDSSDMESDSDDEECDCLKINESSEETENDEFYFELSDNECTGEETVCIACTDMMDGDSECNIFFSSETVAETPYRSINSSVGLSDTLPCNSTIAFICNAGSDTFVSDVDDSDYDSDIFSVQLGDCWDLSTIISQCSELNCCDINTIKDTDTAESDDAVNDGFCDIVAANNRWNDEIDKDCTSRTVSKVTFSEKVEIHSADIWERKGPWEKYACDRMRFHRRTEETGSVLEKVLNTEHRQKIYNNLGIEKVLSAR